MKLRLFIGGVIVGFFVVWGAMAFFRTTVRYVSLEQARNSDRTVQVMGKIDVSSVHFNTRASRFEFAIYDIDAPDTTTAPRLPVIYYGVVPGNFDQATSVVVKGRGDGQVFTADQILVKCPSKYQGEAGDQYQDVRKHQEAQSGT